jgi:2-polyprenyl-3-methyl-5-hydroxy-6-metoxy-1,4-benzoquinol methylase
MKNIACILCGKDNASTIAVGYDRYVNVDKTIFKLVRCNICKLVYINPQPTPDELVKYYPPDYPPFIKADQSVKNIVLPKRASLPVHTSIDNTIKRVLDFGCGSGVHLISIREKHPLWELHGFDIGANKEIINIGNNISIVHDDFDKLTNSFSKEYFDMIYMNNVLEHLNDPVKILSDLSLLLKRNGSIIIEVPNIDSIKFKIFGKYFSSLDIPRHLYNFSPKTLDMLCKKCGLRIDNIKLTGSAKSTLRSTYYMLGIKSKSLNPIIFKIVNVITKILGEKRINDDVIVATVIKI